MIVRIVYNNNIIFKVTRSEFSDDFIILICEPAITNFTGSDETQRARNLEKVSINNGIFLNFEKRPKNMKYGVMTNACRHPLLKTTRWPRSPVRTILTGQLLPYYGILTRWVNLQGKGKNNDRRTIKNFTFNKTVYSVKTEVSGFSMKMDRDFW